MARKGNNTSKYTEERNLEHVQETLNNLVWMVYIQIFKKLIELISWRVFNIRRKNSVGSREPQNVSQQGSDMGKA